MADSPAAVDIERLSFYPLTPDRWADLELLFGERGACGGCWCMYWRLPRAQYEAGKGEPHRQSLRLLAERDISPGILAYQGDTPVGWCAVAPRENLERLKQSHILRPVDDEPVWSVSCFFVTPKQRKGRISLALLRAAVDYVREQGGTIVEGYPVEASHRLMPAAFAWTGFASTFLEAGFTECARRSDTRPIMRLTLA